MLIALVLVALAKLMAPPAVTSNAPPFEVRKPKPTSPVASKSIAPPTVIEPLPSRSPAVTFRVRSVPIVPLFSVIVVPVILVVVPLIALLTTAAPVVVTAMLVVASSVPAFVAAALSVIPAPLSTLPAPVAVFPIVPLNAVNEIALGEVIVSNNIFCALAKFILLAVALPRVILLPVKFRDDASRSPPAINPAAVTDILPPDTVILLKFMSVAELNVAEFVSAIGPVRMMPPVVVVAFNVPSRAAPASTNEPALMVALPVSVVTILAMLERPPDVTVILSNA